MRCRNLSDNVFSTGFQDENGLAGDNSPAHLGRIMRMLAGACWKKATSRRRFPLRLRSGTTVCSGWAKGRSCRTASHRPSDKRLT